MRAGAGHSRRELLGGSAAALLLVAPAAGEAKAAELDGELIRLCEEYVAADREFCGLTEESADWTGDHPGSAENERQQRAVVDRLHELKGRLADFRPKTPEGLRAMALAALRSMSGNLDEDPTPMRWEDNIAWAVCGVLAGRA